MGTRTLTSKSETKTVRKWGNGLGILLPKSFVKEYNLKKGDNLQFIFNNGEYILKNSDEDKLNIPDYNLDDLMIEFKNQTSKTDFWKDSGIVGREIW